MIPFLLSGGRTSSLSVENNRVRYPLTAKLRSRTKTDHVGAGGKVLDGYGKGSIFFYLVVYGMNGIPRVFLKDPSVLVMDEATSGLDNDSQARIQQIIESQWKGRSTVIAVAHRLDTIKTYDHIAVMKGGEIVEMGGYDELIEKKGTLFKLVEGAGRS